MIVGIDIDGVMTDYHHFKLETGSRFFGKEPSDPSAYALGDIFPESPEILKSFWRENYISYLKDYPAKDGLFEFSRTVYEKGHTLVVITNRTNDVHGFDPAEILRLTEAFLDKNLYKYEAVYYSRNNKADIARDLGIGCMIEDSVRFIKSVSEVCPVIYPVTVYNKNLGKSENIYPAKDLFEVTKIFESLF